MPTPSEKEYMKKYRADNAERLRAYSKKWREDNKETHLPKKTAYMKKWRIENPEAVKLQNKIKHLKHRDKNIARVKEWGAKNPEKVKQNYRKCHLKMKYGITPEEWDGMFERQGKSCAICRTTELRGRRKQWDTDHCHASGKVRGILCHPCNLMLGAARDNRDTLRSAIGYLTLNP